MKFSTLFFFIGFALVAISLAKSLEEPQKSIEALTDDQKHENSVEPQFSVLFKRFPRDVSQTIEDATKVSEAVSWFEQNKWIVIGIGAIIVIMIVCCIWDTICCCC